MKRVALKRFLLSAFCLILFTGIAFGQRKMEKLGRGVVATRTSSTKVLVSWRLLGTEPQDIGFNVYRSTNGGTAVKLNISVLTQGTNFEDNSANLTVPNSYFVKPVMAGIEKEASAPYTLVANPEAKPFYKIKIRNTPNYRLEYAYVGDFDGDGEYDYVLHKIPITSGTGPDLVEAYKRDGTYLWTVDMGPNSVDRYNITPGSSSLDAGHGDNWTVYDINNDGKAEVIVRTANGVKFSDGTVLTDPDNGKQFISILNGMTGKEISRTLVPNPYLNVGDKDGQMNGHMGIAYLDGINPSLVWMAANRNADGTFNEVIHTWDWNGSGLTHRWQFDLAGKNLASAHQIKIFDLDGDGKDEIVPQAFAVDDNGTLLYNLKDHAIDHGDRFAITDMDPDRPGLEMYGVQQGYSKWGLMWYYCDAKTGKLLHSQSNPDNPDVGRGMTGDFDPRHLGHELYTFVGSLYNVKGQPVSTALPSSYPNQRMYWDADLGSEILDGGKIVEWNYLTNNESRLYTANSTTGTGANASVPGTTPLFYGDLIGDWREEAVYESADHEYLIVLQTPYFTTERIYTLPHNPGYRNDMCLKGYYQSNNPDYYLGFDMQAPPLPPIQHANEYWVGNTSLWDNTSTNWSDGLSPKAFANGDTLLFDIRGNSADTIRLNTAASPAKIWLMNPGGKDYVVAGSGKLTGTAEVWKAKEGAFTLVGHHDYTGATLVSEGQYNIDGSLQSPVTVKGLGAVGGRGTLSGGVTLHKGVNINGGRLSPGFGNMAEQLGTLTIAGNLSVPGENNFAFDVVPGSAKINDSLVVTGNLSFSGVNRLIVAFAGNNFVPGTYTLIQCNGTLTASAANFTIEGIVGVPKQLLIENNAVKVVINATRQPAAALWKGTLNTAWDFDNKNFSVADTATAFVSGDALVFNATAVQRTVGLNETVYPVSVTFSGDSSYTLQGTGSIAGATGLTKNDGGNLTISSVGHAYTGKTIVNGGTLTVAKIGTRNEPSSIGSSDSAAANIQLTNANLVITEKNITDRALTISGSSTLTTPVADNYVIFDGNITGTGSLIKDGPGSIYLIGAKNFSGPVVIKAGAINLRTDEGNQYGLGTNNNVTIENAMLAMEDLQNNSKAYWNIYVPDGKNATLKTDGRSTLYGSLSGSGTLNLDIPYIRTDFRGNWSAFTGRINVLTGDFRIGNNTSYANAAIHLVGGKMYTISGGTFNTSIGELSGVAGTSITSDNSTANWIVGAKNTDATFSGSIAKTALTKTGTGTFTMNGSNTYTGTTSVNQGRLLVNNTSGVRGLGTGAVTVANGAVLGGTGFIKGAITVNSSGKIQPGANGMGTLTDSTSVTFSSGAIAEMEIDKSSGSFDILRVIGNITFSGTLVVSKVGNADFVAGDSYKLFNATTYSGNFTSIEPATPGPGLTWSFTPSTGTLSVTAGVLPVTLASFTAHKQDRIVVLNWETYTEINNERFLIERSADGVSFERIADVKGAGYSTSTQKYSHTDRKPNDGMNYYRIAQVDVDGKRSLSKVERVDVRTASGDRINVYPNPTSGYIQLSIPSPGDLLALSVMSSDGKVLLETRGSLEWLNQQLLKSTQSFKPGVYLVRVISGPNVFYSKYIKQ